MTPQERPSLAAPIAFRDPSGLVHNARSCRALRSRSLPRPSGPPPPPRSRSASGSAPAAPSAVPAEPLAAPPRRRHAGCTIGRSPRPRSFRAKPNCRLLNSAPFAPLCAALMGASSDSTSCLPHEEAGLLPREPATPVSVLMLAAKRMGLSRPASWLVGLGKAGRLRRPQSGGQRRPPWRPAAGVARRASSRVTVGPGVRGVDQPLRRARHGKFDGLARHGDLFHLHSRPRARLRHGLAPHWILRLKGGSDPERATVQRCRRVKFDISGAKLQ